jgi:energy-coupling factor transporter transmembrane protein EcfT
MTYLFISFFLRFTVIVIFCFLLALVFVLVLGIVFRFSFLLFLALLLFVLLHHFLYFTLLGFFFLLCSYCLIINDGRSETLVSEMSGTDVEKVLRNSHLRAQAYSIIVGHSKQVSIGHNMSYLVVRSDQDPRRRFVTDETRFGRSFSDSP